MADGTMSYVHLLPPLSFGLLNFVGQTNPEPSKFSIVSKESDVAEFAQRFFIEKCKLKPPKILISIACGVPSFKVKQTIIKGILYAAQNSKAWIVTGGVDIQILGEAAKQETVPCIGIASLKKVSNNACLQPALSQSIGTSRELTYSPEKENDNASAALNLNHSHFVFVDSPQGQWNEEAGFRRELEDFIVTNWSAHCIMVVINGSIELLQTVLEGVRRNLPIIVVEGSGRLSDAIAYHFRYGDENVNEELDTLLHMMAPEKKKECLLAVAEICGHKSLTVINLNNAKEDIGKAIFHTISRFQPTFAKKLENAVPWGVDLMGEVLESGDDISVKNEDKVQALTNALQKALQLNKPEVYDFLVSKGAEQSSFNLCKLYNLPEVQYHVSRISLRDLVLPESNEKTPLLTSMAKRNNSQELTLAKTIVNTLVPLYSKLPDKELLWIGALAWAIIAERYELAKVIWQHSVLSVHSALVARHLHFVLSKKFIGDEDCQNSKAWFEDKAISILSELEYEEAKKVLGWKWVGDGGPIDALDIAKAAEYKEFFMHQYVQRFLDERWYSNTDGRIPPGTRLGSIFLLALNPFWINSSKYYEKNETPENPVRFYCFYGLPVVKLISNSIAYMLFLLLISANVISCKPGEYDIRLIEWVMWMWMVAFIVEEGEQFLQDRETYFTLLTNQLDCAINGSLLISVGLRVSTWYYKSATGLEVYADILIVVSMMCCLRFMNVFTFSKNLGPLFFIIMRLFKDVLQWLFICLFFMISFQLGVFSLAQQAGLNPWAAYPSGTLGVGISIFIGDIGDTLTEVNGVGVILLSIYSIISQIILVNLLIAMMGNTYSTVSGNSYMEWAFYRYDLTTDWISSSTWPPPFSFLASLLAFLKKTCKNFTYDILDDTATELDNNDKLDATLQQAKERLLEKGNNQELESISSVATVVRNLAVQHENDRDYLEYSIKNIQTQLQVQLHGQRQGHSHAREKFQLQEQFHVRLQEQLQAQQARIEAHFQAQLQAYLAAQQTQADAQLRAQEAFHAQLQEHLRAQQVHMEAQFQMQLGAQLQAQTQFQQQLQGQFDELISTQAQLQAQLEHFTGIHIPQAAKVKDLKQKYEKGDT